MKGIGLHPNIVTMVGACTTRDPIALIMEYVPYGNLQSFLKSVDVKYSFSKTNTLQCFLKALIRLAEIKIGFDQIL
jgi:serine/threonine protein kinase